MISFKKAQKEYSIVRKTLFDYFSKNHKAEISKLERESAEQIRLPGKKSINEDDFGSAFSFRFSYWLQVAPFNKLNITPFDFYALDQLDVDYHLEEMIHIKRLYKGAYFGCFKPLNRQEDGGLIVRNIISGENTVIYSSDEDFVVPDSIFHDSLLLQAIEDWKGYLFCCGNGTILPSKALGTIIHSFSSLSIFNKMFFSSKENKENAYEIAANFKNTLVAHFGSLPLNFLNHQDFMRKMNEFHQNNKKTHYPYSIYDKLVEHLPDGPISMWISKEGYHFFADYPNFLQDISDYPTMKKKQQTQVFDLFIDYLESTDVPTEALTACLKKNPQSVNILLKDINDYYHTHFESFGEVIDFMRPFHKAPLPNIITIPPRLNSYYFGQQTDVGLNDVCPCGSEKKFKKCCGS